MPCTRTRILRLSRNLHDAFRQFDGGFDTAVRLFVVAHVDRAWRLRSWDGFEIPKPFARVTIVYGAPERVVDEDVRAAAARMGEVGDETREHVRQLEVHPAPRTHPLALEVPGCRIDSDI